MKEEKPNANDIADSIISLNENMGICDTDTATGFKTSKKKDILKSSKESSFGRFNQEIIKRQNKKN